MWYEDCVQLSLRKEGCLEFELQWSLCGRKAVWSLCGRKAIWSICGRKGVWKEDEVCGRVSTGRSPALSSGQFAGLKLNYLEITCLKIKLFKLCTTQSPDFPLREYHSTYFVK